jgi:hypothetical protein
LEGVETVARWTARLRHAANPLKIDGSRSILRFWFVKKLSLAISLFRVGREQARQGDFVERDRGLGLEAFKVGLAVEGGAFLAEGGYKLWADFVERGGAGFAEVEDFYKVESVAEFDGAGDGVLACA